MAGNIMRESEGRTGQGKRDQERYAKKLQKTLREQLPHIAGNAPIITGDGKDVVKVPIKSLSLPRYKYASDNDEEKYGVGQGKGKPGDIVGRRPPTSPDDKAGNTPGEHDIEITIDEIRDMVIEELGLKNLRNTDGGLLHTPFIKWNSIAREGSQNVIDHKETLKEAIARSKAMNTPLSFPPEVFRYHSWTEHDRPKTSAVLYLLRDVSGSMGDSKKYLSRVIAMLAVLALQSRYDKIEISFWLHDVDAYEATEHEFIATTEGGGTAMSRVYDAVYAHSNVHYPKDKWNRYVMHFSDGDIFDPQETEESMRQILPTLNQLGLVFVRPGSYLTSSYSSLFFAKLPDPFIAAFVTDEGDVLPALRRLYSTTTEE